MLVRILHGDARPSDLDRYVPDVLEQVRLGEGT